MDEHVVPKCLKIATRQSRLALWQAHHVQSVIQRYYPACTVEIVGLSTRGDEILDQPLSKIGGKGLFIKELERALLAGQADLAVHSLKDVPMELPPEFLIAAIPPRELPWDAFVSNRFQSLSALPSGAVLGTSSLRREAALRKRYPNVEIVSLRGNLDTRLAKLDAGTYDAIILAAAGLIRLNLASRIRAVLPVDHMLPAPGQGALAIEICRGRPELEALLRPLNDPLAAACVAAERAFSRRLGGSCDLPLGAYAHHDGGQLHLSGFVAAEVGAPLFEGALTGAIEQPEALGIKLAETLIAEGASAVTPSSVVKHATLRQ